MAANYDFSGWATKNNIKCSDGRTIMKDAFKDQNGAKVPLVWNHDHSGPDNVLGHAILENREEGVYAYCSFNNTERAQDAKELLRHGDIGSLSIHANQLKQNKNRDVLHGVIREVSLVLAGANPGATIDFPVLQHGEDGYEVDYDEAIVRYYEDISLEHGELPSFDDEKEPEESEEEKEVVNETKEEVIEHAEESKEDKNMADEQKKDGDKTIADVIATMNEEQKTAMYAVVGQAIEDAKSGGNDEDEEDNDVKHNAFDNEGYDQGEVLTHAEITELFDGARREKVSSLKDYMLEHSIDTTGMEVATGTQTYGFNDASMLLPEYKNLNNTPEWIKRDTGWVATVINGVHKTPFSRIRSTYANITEDEARAKGYIKGHEKKEEVFTTLKRTTDPQTVYKKQKLDRDDIIDITDFNVVSWIRGEMDMMLDEELARAYLIGDGRPTDSEDKIQEAHIRPIAKDVPLFNVKVNVAVPAGATGAEKADAIIDSVLRARKQYKGSGNPTFFTTEDWLTEMLLLKDGIGHRMYKTEAELATALRVSKIVTVEVMEGYEIDDKPLVGVIVNLTDYNVGADKGGEKNLFDDFDIDYNQYKYLIETRRSGALVKPYSAMTVLIDEAAGSTDGENDGTEG
jgi:HK97 family phage prohead protease